VAVAPAETAAPVRAARVGLLLLQRLARAQDRAVGGDVAGQPLRRPRPRLAQAAAQPIHLLQALCLLGRADALDEKVHAVLGLALSIEKRRYG